MPTLLYINTAEKQLEIALSVKEQLFVWNSKVEISSQAQMINIAIEDLLIQAEKSLKDLNAIVICGGPGSYTGLRVGLSTAKGICFALNLPLLMISSLELSLISSYNVKNTNEVVLTLKEARAEEAFIRISKGSETLFMNHVYHKDLLDLEHEFQFTSIFAKEVPDNMAHLTIQDIKNTNWEAWRLWAINKYQSQSFENLAYVEPYYLKDVYITTSKKKLF